MATCVLIVSEAILTVHFNWILNKFGLLVVATVAGASTNAVMTICLVFVLEVQTQLLLFFDGEW